MLTSKSSTFKKVVLIILAVLATAAVSVCLYFVAGCSLILGPDGNTDRPDDKPPDVTQTETQGSARLDAVNKTLYVPDRTAEGYTYLKIEQRYTVYGSVKTQILAEVDATDMQAEDGYFAVGVNGVYYGETDVSLSVWYFKSSTDRTGDKTTFRFPFGGKIAWDEDHCTLNNETGEYTWTAVDGATGYAIAVNGGAYDTIVDSPKFTVDDSVYEFTVLPVFEKGDMYGSPVTIRLDMYGIDRIRYDADAFVFAWSRSYDSEYAVHITDGDEVTECTAEVDTDYGRGYAVVRYIPVTDSVKIQVTAYSKMFRPFVGDEQTFGVYHGPEDIAVDDTTGELTWSKIDGFDNYTLVLEYADGTTETHDLVDKHSFSQPYAKTGAIKAKIKANVYGSPYISFFSEPFEFWNLRLAAFEPKIEYGSYAGRFTVSVAADPASVAAYEISFVYESGEQTVTVDSADAVDGKISETLTIPKYELIDIRVSRRFVGTEGRIYFRGDRSDFTQRAIALDSPDVAVTNKNATKSSEDGFTVNVSFPQALKGKGSLGISYRYQVMKFVGGYDTVTKANTVSDDDGMFFVRPVYRNGINSLRVTFSGFYKNDGTKFAVYASYFSVNVGALGSTYVSYANESHIGWKAVDGADEYVVRATDPDGVSQTFTTTETTYAHGIADAGRYWFAITPVSNREFTMDGDEVSYAVEKLEKPTVALDGRGELSATAPQSNVDVVVKLNGEEKRLTNDALRSVLNGDAEASLEVYCTRDGSSTQRYYVNSESVCYTLHRIPEVDADSLGLAVDVSENIVYWAAAGSARDYLCRLYRRDKESDEFALIDEFTQGLTEIDGGALGWGLYKLEVLPLGFCADGDMYLYLDDSAEGAFAKDGIKSATLTGSLSFSCVTGYFADHLNFRTRAVALDGGLPKSVGSISALDLEKYFTSDLRALAVGEHKFTVLLTYDNETKLTSKNTLKADPFVLPFEVKKSETPGVKSGSYTLSNLQDNSALDTASVEIVPTERVLNSAETYYTVYKTHAPQSSVKTKVRETAGLVATATVSSAHVNCFTLRVVAEKFTTEVDGFVYYKTSDESESNYSFAANSAYTPTVTRVAEYDSSVNVYIDINCSVYDDDDAYLLQYKKANGTWTSFYHSSLPTTRFISHFVYEHKGSAMMYSISKSNIKADSDIVLRLLHRTRVTNGVTFDDSCWFYMTVQLSDETA